jgi:hypothetical protein
MVLDKSIGLLGDNEKLPIDISKVDYGKFFNNTYVNVFMMINVVLGLMLLDRYLAAKRKNYRKKLDGFYHQVR